VCLRKVLEMVPTPSELFRNVRSVVQKSSEAINEVLTLLVFEVSGAVRHCVLLAASLAMTGAVAVTVAVAVAVTVTVTVTVAVALALALVLALTLTLLLLLLLALLRCRRGRRFGGIHG